jgi:serine/threonine-protein kinase
MKSSLLGTKIAHFRVVDELGSGGMGEVYVGFDEKLERKVALKVLRADRMDSESKARFMREARVLSQLAHPGICQIFDLIEGQESDVLERVVT